MHQIEGIVISKKVIKHPNKCILKINHLGNEYCFQVPPKKISQLVEIDKGTMVRAYYTIRNNKGSLTLDQIENLTQKLTHEQN